MNFDQDSIKLHQKNKGKIEIISKVNLKTKKDLSLAYTPGVGSVCKKIAENNKNSWSLTNRANQVAIVSDGTAILGLGDLGPEAAMPVMEGKAIIFKEFAKIDAVPLCINTTKTEEIIKFCKNIEPSFAGINLEDISAPRCFEILKRLEKELNIPVFHDDQDGTAIVTLAALINACKLTSKKITNLKIAINGAGAAGIAITNLLTHYGIKDITLADSKEIVCNLRKDLNSDKQKILKQINKNSNIKIPNKDKICGTLEDALVKADVFIGVSIGNLVTVKMIKSMNKNPIILAMANPIPEIMPNIAKKAGAAIVGTGRSDFSNQINNALVFPGIFKGLLKNKVKQVTKKMKIKAAIAIANSINPSKDNILPKLTDKFIVDNIANVIK